MLVQKKKVALESRRQHLPIPLPEYEDERIPLQYRKQLLDDDPDDADPPPFTTTDAVAHYHTLQILHPPDSDDSDDSELSPQELIEAIIESTCMNTLDGWGSEAINLMVLSPDFTVLRNASPRPLCRRHSPRFPALGCGRCFPLDRLHARL
jgi:hypothetical protein